jgi:hypothetical protein
MKLLLLKILLQRRARDEGFTLPMVIALGLVMFLLGAINITAANEENLTAISQNSRSDALAVAEIGIARYRELLDRNRVLAVYDSDQWTARTDVCDSDLTPQPIIDSQDLNNDGDTTENRGSYSLVSYDYSNANGIFDQKDDAVNNNARGILTVQGATPDGSQAQIEVEIPIRINLDDMTNLAPALWIGDSTVSTGDLLPLTIGNGNIVIKDQASADGCSGFSTLASSSITFPVLPITTPPTLRGTVISDSRDLPPIQSVITDILNASNVTGDKTNDLPSATGEQVIFGSTANQLYKPGVLTANFLLPDPTTGEKGSCGNIKDCRYYYDPTDTAGLTYTDKNLLTDGIAKTTLLLNQNLEIKAGTKDVKVGSTSSLINDSNGFEIYVNGNREITIDASGGNITINGFIHAPESKLIIKGSGTVNINGSVWVNDFENTNTNAVTISPDTIKRSATPSSPATSDKAYKFYSITERRTPRPLTGSPTNWKTEEVE